MPKVKVPRRSTHIDMTAMCDVAFLLLTFFMLTTKFKADEAVIVDTPSSISEIKLPDTDIMTITIDRDGKVFFGIDGKYNRENLIGKVGAKYNLSLTEDAVRTFSLTPSFGIPISALPQYLAMSPEDQKAYVQPGIPVDSTNNELGMWVIYGRLTNPKFRIAIRGDGMASYPIVKRVMNTLQEKNVNKFNLITDLEANPAVKG